MKRVSKITALVLTFIMLLSIGITPAFAASSGSTSVSQAKLVDETTLNLDSADLSAHKSYSASLASKLKGAPISQYDNIVRNYCASNKNPVFESVSAFVKSNSSKSKALYLQVPEKFFTKYETVYTINKETILTVTPTYIEIDTLSTNISNNTRVSGLMATAATSSTSGTSSKTYYGILGNKLFSLSVECSFYYNGSKAWYKSGFDYYYTKGTLSIWQVSNWRGWKEESGTSYKAYCSGNFHWGAEYEGNGLIIQDFYCKNTVACSKTGTISRSANMS